MLALVTESLYEPPLLERAFYIIWTYSIIYDTVFEQFVPKLAMDFLNCLIVGFLITIIVGLIVHVLDMYFESNNPRLKWIPQLIEILLIVIIVIYFTHNIQSEWNLKGLRDIIGFGIGICIGRIVFLKWIFPSISNFF
jgi:flagellar biosynthesis protein FliQ